MIGVIEVDTVDTVREGSPVAILGGHHNSRTGWIWPIKGRGAVCKILIWNSIVVVVVVVVLVHQVANAGAQTIVVDVVVASTRHKLLLVAVGHAFGGRGIEASYARSRSWSP